TTATRRTFERIYDLPERVLPAEVLALPTPTDHDAHVELTRRAARALGVGNRRDLRDYFRTSIADTNPAIDQLLESGELTGVAVEGLKGSFYMPSTARLRRLPELSTLLAPFDPVVWERDRTHDLFGFHYRLEIYTPAHKRVHGYYVLPFLLGDRLVARVDLKADRAQRTLRVHAAHGEDGIPPNEVAEALLAELRLLAAWLELDEVAIGERGDLAKALRAQLPAASPGRVAAM